MLIDFMTKKEMRDKLAVLPETENNGFRHRF